MEKAEVWKKDRILKENGVVYCYNYTEERAVKIEKDSDEATIKTVSGYEYQVNYEASDVAGEAFAFGEMMTKEEYDYFPDCITVDELSMMEIKEDWRSRDKIEELCCILDELLVIAEKDDVIICIQSEFDTERKNEELAIKLDLQNGAYEIDLLSRFLQERQYTEVSEDDERQDKWEKQVEIFEKTNPDAVEEFSNKYHVWESLSDKSEYRLSRITDKLYKKLNHFGKRRYCELKQHNPDSELLKRIESEIIRKNNKKKA